MEETVKKCIGWAVSQLQQGKRIRRAGWNGKNMWLSLTLGRTVAAEELWSEQNQAFARESNGCIEVLSYVTMKTADNKIVPWLCSQTDLLATDWEEEVEENKIVVPTDDQQSATSENNPQLEVATTEAQPKGPTDKGEERDAENGR